MLNANVDGPAPGTVALMALEWIDPGAMTLRRPSGRLHALFDGHALLNPGDGYEVAGDTIKLARVPAFTLRAVVAAAHG